MKDKKFFYYLFGVIILKKNKYNFTANPVNWCPGKKFDGQIIGSFKKFKHLKEQFPIYILGKYLDALLFNFNLK